MTNNRKKTAIRTAGQEQPKATAWQVDPGHSAVELSVKHLMFSTVRGRLAGASGTLLIDESNPARSSVEMEFEAATIDTGQPDRDAHLRSPDFLDVANHPKIVFKSTAVDPLSQDRLRIAGELTVRGTTRPVELEATFNGRGSDPWGREIAGFTARTEIDRRDFGLTWNQELESGGVLVGHKIQVVADVEAMKSAPETS